MKKSGQCPKCGCTTLLEPDQGTWPGMHAIRIDATSSALVQLFVCADCGYVEAYVPSSLDRRKLAERMARKDR